MQEIRYRTPLQQAVDDLMARRGRIHTLRLQAHALIAPGHGALRVAGLSLVESLMERAQHSVQAAVEQLDEANQHLRQLAARDPLLREQRLHAAPPIDGDQVIDMPFREISRNEEA